MKLKTKLIPLASVAVACSTAIPLTLTSCGSKYVDLMKIHNPTYDKLDNVYDEETGQYTYKMSELDENETPSPLAGITSATEAWTKLMTEHPKYFAEDYYWTVSNAVNVINTSKAVRVDEAAAEQAEAAEAAVGVAAGGGSPQEIETEVDKISKGDDATMNKTYTRAFEKISDFDIKTQTFSIDFTDFDEETTRGTWRIPTISFRLDYDRLVETTLVGNDGRSAEYTTRYKGYRIYDNVPVIITLQECSFLPGAKTFNVIPIFEWGTDEFTSKVENLATHFGMSTIELVTKTPINWSIKRCYTETRNGVISDLGGDHIIDWTSDDDMTLDLESIRQMHDDADVLGEFTYGLSTSWYLYSVVYQQGGLSSLWNLEE